MHMHMCICIPYSIDPPHGDSIELFGMLLDDDSDDPSWLAWKAHFQYFSLMFQDSLSRQVMNSLAPDHKSAHPSSLTPDHWSLIAPLPGCGETRQTYQKAPQAAQEDKRISHDPKEPLRYARPSGHAPHGSRTLPMVLCAGGLQQKGQRMGQAFEVQERSEACGSIQ